MKSDPDSAHAHPCPFDGIVYCCFFFVALHSLLSLAHGTSRFGTSHLLMWMYYMYVYVYTWILDHFVKNPGDFFFYLLFVHVHAQNSSEGANSVSLKMLKNGKEREIERERILCEREWASESVRCGWDTYVHMLQRSLVCREKTNEKRLAMATHIVRLLCMDLFRCVSSDWSSRKGRERMWM